MFLAPAAGAEEPLCHLHVIPVPAALGVLLLAPGMGRRVVGPRAGGFLRGGGRGSSVRGVVAGGGGGGVGGPVLVEVALGLLHVLAEALLLELAVVAGGVEEVGGGPGDPGPVDLVGLVAEGGLGGLRHELGAGHEVAGVGRLVGVGMRGGRVVGRIHLLAGAGEDRRGED